MPSKKESIELAKWLVKGAKFSNSDAVKFQLVIADELATKEYQYYDLFKKLEIGYEGFEEICDLANNLGIEIIFDIFGPLSLEMAENLNIKTINMMPLFFVDR